MLVPDEGEALRDTLEAKYPTGSLAVMEFDGPWADLSARTAKLTRFVRPRDLDASLGPDAD